MNTEARDALVAAQLRGVRQIRGGLYDYQGGRCALGVLYDAMPPLFGLGLESTAGLRGPHVDLPCPHECGEVFRAGEDNLISHLNDDHGDDFITIANKLHDPSSDV
jgi:hypothetical protein